MALPRHTRTHSRPHCCPRGHVRRWHRLRVHWRPRDRVCGRARLRLCLRVHVHCQPHHRIRERLQLHHSLHMRTARTGVIATAHAGLPSHHPTSLLATSPKNNKPCLQQVPSVPTHGVYVKDYSFGKDISKIWKFHKFREIRETLDPEGALTSNIIKCGSYSNLMTLVWQIFCHKLVRECDNMALF